MGETFINPDAGVQRIELQSTNGKQATVIVDGIDISKYVVKVEFYMQAGSNFYPRAYIELSVDVADLKINAPVDIMYETAPDESDQSSEAKVERIHERDKKNKLRRTQATKDMPSRGR